MKKTLVKMIKLLYLGISILDISKILVYEFWYDYIKPVYGDRTKLSYTDTDSFVIYIEAKDFFEDISNDLERQFDTSMMKMTKDRFQQVIIKITRSF